MKGVYFIMGTTNARYLEPLAILESALAGGISYFQLREKGLGARTGKALFRFAGSCQSLCARYRVPFIVNDDVELAIALRADGIHVGQSDASCRALRERVGTAMQIGVSAHGVEEARRAVNDGADYIGVGPMYPTSSKLDAREATGPSQIRAILSALPSVPLTAIGGIDAANAPAVIAAGAPSIAVISAIASSQNPERAARQLASLFEQEAFA